VLGCAPICFSPVVVVAGPLGTGPPLATRQYSELKHSGGGKVCSTAFGYSLAASVPAGLQAGGGVAGKDGTRK